MDWLVGFVLGFVVDLGRSVFLPASTDYINQFIPSARRKANVTENALTLDVMEKLKGLGKDPNLVRYARDDATQFLHVLTSQQDAFVEYAIEVIDSTYMTQTDMNFEAARRAEVARLQLDRAVIALERSGWLDPPQVAALHAAQARWEEYAQAQAEFAAAEFEGGTMAPMARASELETVTISRTGELRRLLEEMGRRYGD